MNVFIRKVKKKLFGSFHFSLNNDVKNTVLVAGVGRSGTTWLSDIINYKNDYRDMFEPFYNERVEMCRPLKNKLYLRRDEEGALVKLVFEKILSGKIRDRWCDSQNKKIITSRRIIKDIRLNLALGWIKSKFPQIPIIFIMRNPFAVAISKIKLGWDLDMNEYLSQNALVEDCLSDKLEYLKSLETPFDRFMAQWCIENYIPLKQLNEEEFKFVFYENICITPSTELRAIFDYLGKDFTDDVLKTMKRPSSVSRSDSAIKSEADLVSSWKKHCSDEDYKSGLSVLHKFSMDKIYDDMGIPNEDFKLDDIRCI